MVQKRRTVVRIASSQTRASIKATRYDNTFEMLLSLFLR